MRKLATIRQIKEVIEIPKANNIEIIKVDGWQLIAKKNEFKGGDLCCFFEIDSVLPKIEIFDFMKSRKYRVKTAKFMKNISQGLALPISILNEFGIENVTLGQDVTDIIGVKHHEYVKELEKLEKESDKKSWLYKLLMRFEFTRKIIQKLNQKSTFPTHIVKKTEEERIQNLGNYDIEKRFSKTIIDIAEKLDGTSSTYIYRPNTFFQEFLVCSRNQYLKKPDNSYYWKIAKQEDILEKMKSLHRKLNLSKSDYLILQGEIIGKGIQKNKYNIEGIEFRAFNVISNNQRMTYHQMKKLLDNKFKLVPFIASEQMQYNSSDFIKFVEKVGSFRSNLNKKIWAEGIVVRSQLNTEDSFKYINPLFLLKYI